MGILLAFFYRRQGPQSPKFRYEIEKELGIEPEDLEEKWRQLNAQQSEDLSTTQPPLQVIYEIVEKKTKEDQ
jgi:hypothetical protein